MVEAILLQISPLIREVLRVCMVNHRDSVMYVEHVLLYGLVLLLLDLIQGPYHGIIVTLITECLLHVHQQVLHGGILAFIQCGGPFTMVPMETGKNVRVHACLIILLKEGIHIDHQSVYVTSAPGSVDLKISISSLAGASCFFSLLPLWPLHLGWQPAVCSLTCSGVPIGVQCPSVWGGRRQASSTHHCALGFRWLSTWSHSPCMGGKPCFSCLFHCGGSPHLLGCASNQLHWRVRLPCIHDWNTMDGVLRPAPQPLAVGGSNCSPSCLHQRKEANGKVGRAWNLLWKSLLHVGPDCMCSILAQALTAQLVVKEQIGSAQAIHLHMFQLFKDWITLQYMHDHPGWSAIITSSIMAYSSAGVPSIPSPTSTSASAERSLNKC